MNLGLSVYLLTYFVMDSELEFDIVADQIKLVVRRDARVDEEIGHHRDNSSAEINQKCRQSGEGLKNHLLARPRSSIAR